MRISLTLLAALMSTVPLSSVAQSSKAVTVPLAAANVWAIATEGKAVTHGGLDGAGKAYSAAQLSGSVTAAGTTFNLGAPDVADALSNATLPLPAGQYGQLQILAAAANGSQAAQSWTVTYTDGSTTVITQSVSDWWRSPAYSGESLAAHLTHAVLPTGVALTGSFSLYAYSLAIDAGKTVQSLTLPATRNVILLAADLIPAVIIPAPPSTGASSHTLSWTGGTLNVNGSALTDLKGWNVYIGTAPGQYAAPVALAPGVLSYDMGALTPGTYYAVVKTVSASEGESARSAEVSITVAPPAAPQVLRCTAAAPTVTGLQATSTVTCTYGP
jgi:hypothetical protein